jgi:glutathione S-transferase
LDTITHPYFGLLSTSKLQDTDVIWEVPQDLNGKAVETWLWADPATSLDAVLLDEFASTLNLLPQLDQKAREALTQHLQAEGDFIDALTEAASEEGAQGLPAMQTLLGQARAAGQEQIKAADFVAALQLENISLWCSHDDAPVVLDYRLDPEGNDQILAVKCDAQGNITEIAWES